MKAIIVASARSGGTFLATCLSTHPDIHCWRDEPLLKLRALGVTDSASALDYVLDDSYYTIAAAKLTYTQAFDRDVAQYIVTARPAIIHLLREPLEVVTSVLLARQEKRAGQPRHILGDSDFVDDEVLTVPPLEVIRRMASITGRQRQAREMLAAFEPLEVRYADLTDAGKPQQLRPETARAICAHLGVKYAKMTATNRKMHKRTLDSYYTNWPDVRAAIVAHYPTLLPEGL